MFSAAIAQDFLTHLRIWNGRIVVDDIAAARWLGEQFIRLDDACWCSVQEVGWYAVAAYALRAALAHHVISEADFLGTDGALFKRVRAANVPDIQRWLALLRPDVDFKRVDAQPDLVALPKVRAVDPPVLVNEHVKPLSHLDLAFAQHREAYVKSKQGEWGLSIIAP